MGNDTRPPPTMGASPSKYTAEFRTDMQTTFNNVTTFNRMSRDEQAATLTPTPLGAPVLAVASQPPVVAAPVSSSQQQQQEASSSASTLKQDDWKQDPIAIVAVAVAAVPPVVV